MEKTSLNIDENIESLLCYVGLWVTGLIFLLIEKENKTVKFHAKQSLFFFLPLTIIAPIIGWIGSPEWTYTGWLSWIIYIIILIFFIILIITAYQGQKFKIPIVGDLASK